MSNIYATKLALQFAKQAHEGQLRAIGPDTGLPYFDTHIVRCVKMAPPESRPATALHDTVEDPQLGGQDQVTMDTIFERQQIWGLETCQAVDLLTRPESMTYDDYIDRLIAGGNYNDHLTLRIALNAKLADLMDNLSTLPEGRNRKRYIKAMSRVTMALDVT